MVKEGISHLDSMHEIYNVQQPWPFMKDVDRYYNHTSDLDVLESYIESNFSDKTIWIVGAGTHGQYVYSILSSIHSTNVKGFIDRREKGELYSLPCFHPSELTEQVVDPEDVFLVCHPVLEQTLMDSFPEFIQGQIETIYSNKSFSQMAEEYERESVKKRVSAFSDKKRYFIISTLWENWTIISNKKLAQFLSKDDTLHAVYGREERYASSIERFHDDPFETIHAGMSLVFLNQLIQQISPEVIYVRVNPYFEGEFLVPYFKEKYPEIMIVAEHYDFSFQLSDQRLNETIGYGPDTIQLMKSASLYSFQYSDVLVTKNGGCSWSEIILQRAKPVLNYYPLPPQWESKKKVKTADYQQSTKPLHILFAGSLPDMTRQESIPVDMKYYEYFSALADDIKLDIYNAQHITEDEDNLFACYKSLGEEKEHINYYRAAPAQDIASQNFKYSAGWIASHDMNEENVEEVTRHVLGNKFVSYLMAGLPVIIDTRFEFINTLLEEYPVAIVVDLQQPEQMNQLIREADYDKMRSHIPKLLDYLAAKNQCSFDRLRFTMNSADIAV